MGHIVPQNPLMPPEILCSSPSGLLTWNAAIITSTGLGLGEPIVSEYGGIHLFELQSASIPFRELKTQANLLRAWLRAWEDRCGLLWTMFEVNVHVTLLDALPPPRASN